LQSEITLFEPLSGLVVATNRTLPERRCTRGTPGRYHSQEDSTGRKVSTRVWKRGIEDPSSCESRAVRYSCKDGKSDRRFAPFIKVLERPRKWSTAGPGAVARPYQSTPFLHEFEHVPVPMDGGLEHGSIQVPSSISKQLGHGITRLGNTDVASPAYHTSTDALPLA